MRLRGPARLLAVALFASLLSPVVLESAPALAHTSCTASGETDYYPATSPWSDGTKVRIRMVSPVSGAGCSKPSAGWPLIIFLHGWGGNRCSNPAFYTRAATAAHGYVVLSFTMRGGPAVYGTSGCGTALDNAKDTLDDNGADHGGPRDKLDITQLINWARDSYTPSGCADQCVDDSLVGVMGHSFGGYRTWTVGVPGPPGHATHPGPNEQFDDRVKAIVPTAAHVEWDNVKSLTSDGAGTPVLRPRAHNTSALWWANQGWLAHTDRTVTTNILAFEKARFLNESVPQSTLDFQKERYILDDDAAVDKAADIKIPVFVMNGWLDGDGAIFSQAAIEAYNKLGTPSTDKYMYLGSCTHPPDPCHADNATKMRDAVHRFLDRHVRLDTTVYVRPPGTTTCATTGPCVIYTIPPKYTSDSSNPWLPTGQTWTESSATAWPPSGASTWTGYLRNDGTLSSTPEGGTTCTTSTGTGCKAIANNLNLPVYYDFCLGSTYGATEVQSYEVGVAADSKLVKLEADLYLSSDTTRIQVYVDLFDVNSSGTELARIWQGPSQVVPTKRNGTANTVYRFKFVPGGAAWTVANGHKIRVKIASKYAKAFAGEPLPATYTLYHNDTYRSNVTMTFV